MSEALEAKWVRDGVDKVRGEKVPYQLFRIDRIDFFDRLEREINIFKLSPKALELGWNLDGFTIAHSCGFGVSVHRFYDSTNNLLKVKCSVQRKRVVLKLSGSAIEVMKGFFTKFFASVFPERQLAFECLTEEQKRQRLEAKRLEEQQRQEEAERQFKERQEQLQIEMERKRIQRQLDSLTDADYKILELRKQGKSLWGICKELGLSMAQVQHSLRKMSMIPDLAKDWTVGKPMTREEWKASLQKKQSDA